METQHCLSVVVGCPLFLRQLPSGPCLILDSDTSTFESLCSELHPSEHSWPLSFQQVVLSNLSGKNILWRKYNDQRFDGPWEQSVLENDYPNLRQVSTISVQAKTLADVLDSQSFFQNVDSEFNLFIRQGDPLQILEGAKTWLNRCNSIILRGIDVPIGHRSKCAQFLSSNGFSPAEDDNPSIWIPQVMEIKASYLNKLQNSVSALLNQFSYQSLHPHLIGLTADEVLAHWMASPDFIDGANQLFKLLRMSSREFYEIPEDDPCMKALEALFPYHFYRSLRPDLDRLDDRKLIEHFCTNGLKEGIRLEDGVEMQYAVRALRHVFPYSFYRRLCPDLTDLDDESLLLYFCRNGLDQRIDLSEESVQSFAGSFPVSEVEVLKSRVKELEQYLDLSREQVNELRNALMAANKNDDQ